VYHLSSHLKIHTHILGFVIIVKSDSKKISNCPEQLKEAFPQHEWKSVEIAILSKNQKVKADTFVFVCPIVLSFFVQNIDI
jgi:hypothetical protein